jgi:hypothetical protein
LHLINYDYNDNNFGVCVIKQSEEKEYDNRLETLANTVRHWLDPNNISNKIMINLLHQLWAYHLMM